LTAGGKGVGFSLVRSFVRSFGASGTSLKIRRHHIITRLLLGKNSKSAVNRTWLDLQSPLQQTFLLLYSASTRHLFPPFLLIFHGHFRFLLI